MIREQLKRPVTSKMTMVLAQVDRPVNSQPIRFALALKSQHDRRPAYILAPGETIVGSAAGCSLRLDAHGVADVHCVIHSSLDSSELQAQDRRTWLNGYLTTHSRLQDGDRIDIGPIQFCVQKVPVDESLPAGGWPPQYVPIQKRTAATELSKPAHAAPANPRPHPVADESSPRSSAADPERPHRDSESSDHPVSDWHDPNTDYVTDAVRRRHVAGVDGRGNPRDSNHTPPEHDISPEHDAISIAHPDLSQWRTDLKSRCAALEEHLKHVVAWEQRLSSQLNSRAERERALSKSETLLPSQHPSPHQRNDALAVWQPSHKAATQLLKQDVLRLQDQFDKLHRQQQDLRRHESTLANRITLQQGHAQELDALRSRLSDWQRDLESREEQLLSSTSFPGHLQADTPACEPSTHSDQAAPAQHREQIEQHGSRDERLEKRGRQLQRHASEMAEQQLQINQQLMIVANRSLELDELEQRRRGEHSTRLAEIENLQELHDQRTSELNAHTQDLDTQRQDMLNDQRQIERRARELEQLKTDLDQRTQELKLQAE